MADGLSIAASVIAVIQLTAKATSLSYDYINGVKHATDDLKMFKDELESLTGVLTILQDYASASPKSIALRKLDAPLRECIEEMRLLRAKLEPKGWRKRFAMYKWPLKEKETSKYLLKIERLKSTFSLAIDADLLSQSRVIGDRAKLIEDGVQEMNAGRLGDVVVRADERRAKVLNWIYSREYDKRHLEISGRRQNHTGGWLLKAPEVLAWIKKNPTYWLLWGYGIPGAGKTFLSSLMIDDLRSRAVAGNYGVAYVYFNHKEKEQQTEIHVLSSLVKQLACQIRQLPKEIGGLYDKLEPRQERPTSESLYAVLLAVIHLFAQSRAFIICDALDECDDTQRTKLLPLFHRMGGDGISLFLTSREYPEDIQHSLQGSAKIRLSAKDEDITSYIEQKIAGNPRAEGLIRRGNCKERIISELKKCANGMFLLVHFHIKYLCQQTTARQLLDELERIKNSSSEDNSMNPTYNRVMEMIQLQPKSCAQLAYNILSWLVKARRVLSVRELQQAVSVDQNRTTFDELALPSKETMLNVCASMVTIDEDSDTVRLVHYTVQEYLDKNTIIPEDENFKLAMACTTFLSYDVFSEGPCTSKDSLKTRKTVYPFLYYAARHLSLHLKECDEGLSVNLVLRFFGNSQNVLSYLQATMVYDEIDPGILRGHTQYTLLHIAAELNHLLVIQSLLRKGADISAPGNNGETALHIAAKRGYDLVVGLLLDNGASLSAACSSGWTPLHYTVRNLHESTTRLVLKKGADLSATDESGSAPLHIAAENFEDEGGTITQLLLEKGADPSATDKSGSTPLHKAARYWGVGAIIKLLLGGGANLSATDKSGSTPLHIAAANHGPDGEFIVQLLLEKGADPSATDKSGSTPLHVAASEDQEIFRLLLEKGADPSATDKSGSTPLHVAASEDQEIVRLLLEKGADPSARDESGSTPLHIAAESYDEEGAITQLLLEKGADPSATDKSGSTPLHIAAANDGYSGEAIVQLLLEKGADPSATDKSGSTPLHIVVENYGYSGEAIVQLLLEKGADPSATDKSESTPLHIAAANDGSDGEVIVQLLLEKGADPSATDKSGSTPLHIAAENYGEAITQLLLEEGADISAVDSDGRTALQIATIHGNNGILEVLSV